MRWLLAAFLGWTGLAAAAEWSLEAFLGDAYNLRSGLQIKQDGGFSESVRARYDTRGLRSPPHYLVRAGRWEGGRAWELSLLHHKLYLENAPPGVASVSISHGFNIVSVNRAFRAGDWTWRVGAGPVVTHAEGEIRGTVYPGEYRLAGAAVMAGLGRRFYLASNAYVALEGALTAAYAEPRLDGSARLTVRNVAAHALLGLGVDF